MMYSKTILLSLLLLVTSTEGRPKGGNSCYDRTMNKCERGGNCQWVVPYAGVDAQYGSCQPLQRMLRGQVSTEDKEETQGQEEDSSMLE